jgi:hypothetical protein
MVLRLSLFFPLTPVSDRPDPHMAETSDKKGHHAKISQITLFEFADLMGFRTQRQKRMSNDTLRKKPRTAARIPHLHATESTRT